MLPSHEIRKTITRKIIQIKRALYEKNRINYYNTVKLTKRRFSNEGLVK